MFRQPWAPNDYAEFRNILEHMFPHLSGAKYLILLQILGRKQSINVFITHFW